MKKSNKTNIGKLFKSKLKNNVSENILTNKTKTDSSNDNSNKVQNLVVKTDSKKLLTNIDKNINLLVNNIDNSTPEKQDNSTPEKVNNELVDSVDKLVKTNEDQLGFDKDKLRDEKLAKKNDSKVKKEKTKKAKKEKFVKKVKDDFSNVPLVSGLSNLFLGMSTAFSTIAPILPVLLKVAGVAGAVVWAGYEVTKLSNIIYDSLDKDKEWMNSLSKQEKELSVNRAIDSELYTSIKKQEAKSIVDGYNSERDLIKKQNKLVDERAGKIAKENGITKEEVLANSDKYKSISALVKNIKSMTGHLDEWSKKLNDVDDDLGERVLQVSYLEKKINDVENKMKNVDPNSVKGKELAKERQNLQGKKFTAETLGQALNDKDSDMSSKDFLNDLNKYEQMQKILSESENPESENIYKEWVELNKKLVGGIGFDSEEINDLIKVKNTGSNISSGVGVSNDEVNNLLKISKNWSEIFKNVDLSHLPTKKDDRKSTDTEKINAYNDYKSKTNRQGYRKEQLDGYDKYTPIKILDKLLDKNKSIMETSPLYQNINNSNNKPQNALSVIGGNNNLIPDNTEFKVDTKAKGGNLTNKPTIVGENGAEIINNGKVLSPLTNEHNDKLTDIFKDALNGVNDNSNLERLLIEQNQLLGALLNKNQGIVNNTNVNTTNVAIKPKSGNRFINTNK